MAGPAKQFDRDEVLGKALDAFWTKGYEATSMCDLVSSMGINRASLYDTFGNKQALFTQALDWYAAQAQRAVDAILTGPGSPMQRIEKVLTYLSGGMCGKGARGCFISNTAAELGPHDPAIAASVRRVWTAIEQGVQQVLDEAQASGEIGPKVDTRAHARLLNTALAGLALKSKVQVPQEELQEVVQLLMASLRG